MNKRKNFSHKRQAILDVIQSTTSHPTAEWVYEQLKDKFPKLSLATVYRNMSEFKQEGKLKTVAVVEGTERVDGNVKAHPHFICRNCNAVIDVELDISTDELKKSISNKYNLICERADISFTGICDKCREGSQ